MKKLFSSPRELFLNPVIRNSIIVFGGTMFTNFGAYLYHLIVGRIMGPERYGEFAALFSLLFIISVPSQVVQLVLTKYFSIFKATNNTSQARALLFSTLKLFVTAGIIGFVIFLPVIPYLQNFLHVLRWESLLYIYLIFVTSFFVTGFVGVKNGKP